MKKYLGKVKQRIKGFTIAQFQQILKEDNVEAEILSKTASADEIMSDQIKIQYIPGIDVLEVHQIDKVFNWTTPIISYLKDGLLLEDKEEARKLRVKATRFVLMDEVLYKWGFSQPYLRCLNLDESLYVLRDVYEGAYGNHLGAKSLVYQMVRAGYYWQSMQADAKTYGKACDKCQRYSNIPRQPSEYLTPMVAPQPLTQWGLDILSPFPMGIKQMK